MENNNNYINDYFNFMDDENNKELKNILNTLMTFENKFKWEENKITYQYKKSGFKVKEDSFSKVRKNILYINIK
jgi:hypothetical protein